MMRLIGEGKTKKQRAHCKMSDVLSPAAVHQTLEP